MRLLKVIAAAAVAAIALLAAAAGLLLWLFDPNDYKEYLTDWVEERTGRTLIVRDDLELEFFPWLAVETGGVTLGNAAGFDASMPFATAERVAAQVKLLPLLRRQVEIGTIQLDGLELNLARDADGRGNWEDFSTASSPADADVGADESASAAPAGGVNVEGVRIRDGLVYWRENADQLRYVASAITVQTGAISRGEPVDVDLALDVLDVESQRTFGVATRAEVLFAFFPTGASGGVIAAGAARDDGAAGGGGGGLAAARDDGAPDADAGPAAVELRNFALELDVAEAEGAAFASLSFASERVRAGTDGRIDIAAGNGSARLPAAAAPTGAIDAGAAWASIEFDPASGSLRVDSLATTLAGIEAQWLIEGRNVIDAPRLEGAVTVVDAPVADAVAALGLALPSGLEGAALGTADASVEFSVAFATPNEPSRNGAGDDGAFAAGPYRLASLMLNVPNAAAFDVALSGDAQLADGMLAARVSIPPFALGDALVAFAEENAPAGLDFDALGRVALSSRIEGDLRTRRFALRDLDAAILGAQLTGSVDVIPEAGGRVYRGTLRTSRFEPLRLSQFVGDLLAGGIGDEQLGTLALDTRFDYDTRSGGLTLDALSLEAFGLSATGRAAVAGIGESPIVSGEARLAAFSPRDLLARFGQPVPDTSDPSVMQRANLDARFEVGAERGRFTNIDLALDDSRISGDFTVENFTAPEYAFALAIDAVDADRYLPPRAADNPADPPDDADDTPTAGDLELPADALSRLRLDGRVSVGRLKLANLEFQEVATGITVGDGEGRLDSAGAKLYGGEFLGGFHVRAVGDDRSLSLTGRATGLALEPMIIALTGDANFSGTGDFDLRLSGSGATVIDNVRSAGGDVSFSLRSGAISGFNLGRTLCSLYNATQRLPSPAEQPAVTAYEVIGGTAAVSSGVASSMDLLARTSFMDIAGVGSLGLAEQRLDYDLDATLTDSIDIAGCESMEPLIGGSIPFTLRGTVTDPDIRPDFSKLIGQRIREEFQDRVRDRVQDRLRELLR